LPGLFREFRNKISDLFCFGVVPEQHNINALGLSDLFRNTIHGLCLSDSSGTRSAVCFDLE
jgi:hypothetical protein